MRLRLITTLSLAKARRKNSYAFGKSPRNLILGLMMLSGLLSSFSTTLAVFICICLKKLSPPFMTLLMIVSKLSKIPLKLSLRMKLRNLKTFSLRVSQEYRRKSLHNTKRKCDFTTSSFLLHCRVWTFFACASFPLLGARLSRAKDGDILRLKHCLMLRRVGLFPSLSFLSAGSLSIKDLLSRGRLNI